MLRTTAKYLSALLTGLILILTAAATLADGIGPIIPKVPASKATQCVEPTDEMRRNHMEYILHQRDETVHSGIRTSKHSFKECINCHVNADENGEYPHYALGNEEHFCASCHTYTAVNVDCFQCHRDTPSEASRTANAGLSDLMHGATNGELTIEDMKLTTELKATP